MTAKPTRKQQSRATTMVPVATMEELPVLSDDERATLLAELKAAEGEAAAGQAIEYDSDVFGRRLLDIYRNKAR